MPLAAALWAGGISFGGTIAFVFADLITLPLLLIYRKFYGTALTVRLIAVFWATMSAAGLITEYLFRAAGIAPAPGRATARGMIGRDVWAWNYTTALDIVAIAAFAAAYWLYRNRERLGAGGGYAKDPVCGMQVQVEHAPAKARHQGRTYYFCSDHCGHRFSGDPVRFTAHGGAGQPRAASGRRGPPRRGRPGPRPPGPGLAARRRPARRWRYAGARRSGRSPRAPWSRPGSP